MGAPETFQRGWTDIVAPKWAIMEDINRNYCPNKDIWQPGNMSDKGDKEEEEKVRTFHSPQDEQHSCSTHETLKTYSSNHTFLFTKKIKWPRLYLFLLLNGIKWPEYTLINCWEIIILAKYRPPYVVLVFTPSVRIQFGRYLTGNMKFMSMGTGQSPPDFSF